MTWVNGQNDYESFACSVVVVSLAFKNLPSFYLPTVVSVQEGYRGHTSISMVRPCDDGGVKVTQLSVGPVIGPKECGELERHADRGRREWLKLAGFRWWPILDQESLERTYVLDYRREEPRNLVMRRFYDKPTRRKDQILIDF